MHRDRFGVEPICQTLDVSASAYYQRATGERSARRVEDERLTGRRSARCIAGTTSATAYRRVHAALVRDGERVGRDQVARLMRAAGVVGAKRRGKPWRTTIADPPRASGADLVGRDFTAVAPDRLWVGDFTYLRTWEGRVYFAFIIDVYSRMIVGWQLADAHAHRPGARRAADGARRSASPARTSRSSPTPTRGRSTPARTTPSSSTTRACWRRSGRSEMLRQRAGRELRGLVQDRADRAIACGAPTPSSSSRSSSTSRGSTRAGCTARSGTVPPVEHEAATRRRARRSAERALARQQLCSP